MQTGIGPCTTALPWLSTSSCGRDWRSWSRGRYEIDGDRVYAMVAKEPGRTRSDALLETHQNYIDIQLVLTGTDGMGWKPASRCLQPSTTYDPKADFQLFRDEPDAWVSTAPGAFAIFFPEDAHMPLISPGRLHKVVVKVAV